MISNKSREARKSHMPKMSKNIERLYKEGKCSECSVVVTRMDFAKILGKFTKVKIQYENSTSPKGKKTNQHVTSPNTRLKSNENGMVLIHRKAYSQHPVKELKKTSETGTPKGKNSSKDSTKLSGTPRQNNILKENNRIKKADSKKSNNYFKKVIDSKLKTYGVVFVKPVIKTANDVKNKLALMDILPAINLSLLPSDEWSIDYLPKNGEPKEDKVYDRIAAELEDLMNNEKSAVTSENNNESNANKDDFPSILDILNENTSSNSQPSNQEDSSGLKSNIEASDDVEAILMGKSNQSNPVPTPMDVDNSDMSHIINDAQISSETSKLSDACMDNPHSPSILDETLQKGIEEHLPIIHPEVNTENSSMMDSNSNAGKVEQMKKEAAFDLSTVTHVSFKKIVNGVCQKSVTCPRNLKYSVELDGKPVEFLGAPKLISSLEDLQVLLQITNESDLDSLYVLH